MELFGTKKICCEGCKQNFVYDISEPVSNEERIMYAKTVKKLMADELRNNNDEKAARLMNLNIKNMSSKDIRKMFAPTKCPKCLAFPNKKIIPFQKKDEEVNEDIRMAR